MTQRAYTIQEIDALREAERTKYLWGSYSGPSPLNDISRNYREVELERIVEERVRTLMHAGLTVEDLKP